MAIPTVMTAVHTIGHGGLDKLVYKTDVPVPSVEANQVLIRVGASGVNNTDINTRVGWYSKKVTAETTAGATEGFGDDGDDGSWTGTPLKFPLIQGADICGTIVAVGADVDAKRIGERAICRTMQTDPNNEEGTATWTVGSEFNGGFAQYVAMRSSESYAVNNPKWADSDLASIPCAYSTAEGLLERAGVSSQDRVFITGASGGVGSAAIQLAKRRGAYVTAMCSSSKFTEVRQVGADAVIDRNTDLAKECKNTHDVVIDLVAGPKFPEYLEILKPGGRYAVSGAIAGPIVSLDVRTLYLKDLVFYGCTFQPKKVFENLISYIERDEIKPLIAATFPLRDIKVAQQKFLEKSFTGKLVLVPPQEDNDSQQPCN